MSIRTQSASAQIDLLGDELLAHLRSTSSYVRLLSRLPIEDLDDLSLSNAQVEGQFCRERLARLDAILLADLPHDQWLFARMLRHRFANGASAEDDYWLTFAVTPYSGGFTLLGVHRILATQPLATGQDRARYLGLLEKYARLLEQVATKTREQAGRNIRVPQPAIAGVLALFADLRDAAPMAVGVTLERLANVPEADREAVRTAVETHTATRLLPAFERILAVFDASYLAQAPLAVGLGQYPGGRESYLRRIVQGTGLQLTPQEIHDRGLASCAELDRAMQAIRDQLGFKGTRDAFHEVLRNDARFIARTPEDVEQRYLLYMKRIEPRIARYFSQLPRASYAVKRIDAAAEAGMTFGYYQPPTPSDPVGYYLYNGSNLADRSLVTAAHLIYHELVPGHHFHLALQAENKDVHPVREFLYYGAFAEGWAEYGANLAGEMGLYDDPYDLYGHLLSQSFLATRLVVDTGMNALGWSLDEARRFMREHTFESERQIASDSLRYSTDLFAQALDYRLGYDQFQCLRRRAEADLNKRFDVRRFHAAAIGSGAMPLDVLAEHIDWFIAQEMSRRSPGVH